MIKIFLLVFLFFVSNIYSQQPFVFSDFDDVKCELFSYKDEKGTKLSCSSAYRDEQRGNYVGVKYKISSGGWAGVVFFSNPLKALDASVYRYLSFYVKGDKGNEKFDLKIKDANNVEKFVPIENFIEITTKWQKVSIPLNEFSGVNFKSLDNVNLGFGGHHKSGSIYLDDIKFESGISGKEEVGVGVTRSNKVLIDGFDRPNPYDFYQVYEADDSTLRLYSSRVLHDGDYSMELEYYLSTKKPWGSTGVSARWLSKTSPLNWKGLSEVKIWVKGDGSDNVFSFTIFDETGGIWKFEAPEILEHTEWSLLSMPIEKFVPSEKTSNIKTMNMEKIKAFDISVLSKTSAATSGTKKLSGKIWVDQLYIVGEELNFSLAQPPKVIDVVQARLWRIGNVDFTGVIYNEYMYTPEEKSKFNHWGKLFANGKVGNFSGQIDIATNSQEFGDAAYYIQNSSNETSGSQSVGVSIPSIYVMANNLTTYITNIKLGNLWLDYSIYTFTPTWGYKGISVEGDYDILNYHIFVLKHKYNTFTLGTRQKLYWRGFTITAIGVYFNETAKITKSFVSQEGNISSTNELVLGKASDDFVISMGISKRIVHDKITLTTLYGYNKYRRFAQVNNTNHYNPLYSYKLDTPTKLKGDMAKFKIETAGLFWAGMNIDYEYRNAEKEFKPRYRQGPWGFDELEVDHQGHNAKITKWYKGFVVSVEHDSLMRKSNKDYYRYRTNTGIGYYGFDNMDISFNQEYRKDVYKASSSRSVFATDKNEYIVSSELYIRGQITPRLSIMFKPRLDKIFNPPNKNYLTESFYVKMDYYLTPNTKFSGEYKTTRYGIDTWEPKGWPFDDNFGKFIFELTF